MNYADFLASKAQNTGMDGFEPTSLPDHLYPFQRDLVHWAVRKGRAAIFADCGMGKTPMELAWAQSIHEHTGKPVLLLTPLAVGFQVVAEAAKFGHDAPTAGIFIWGISTAWTATGTATCTAGTPMPKATTDSSRTGYCGRGE